MSDFLYYWKRYKDDIAPGRIFKLNQNSPTMTEIRAGDKVWAISRVDPGRYSLVASFDVSSVGDNPYGSPDYHEYGEHFFVADAGSSRYFDTSTNSAEETIRKLRITTNARFLGQSFQGDNGVRRLNGADASELAAFATHLRPLR